MRAAFPVRLALALLVLSAGCFRGVNVDPSKIQCRDDHNCPNQYRCVGATPGAQDGVCVEENADAARFRDVGQQAEVGHAFDGLRPEAQVAADTATIPTGDALIPQRADASADPDAPVAIGDPDAALPSDASATSADARAAGDAPVDAPLGDTAPACNGGCCSNADCPLSAPVCNGANKCVGCTSDQDCAGRSATACKTSTGACVSCTKNDQCSGANATCNLTTNTCVGCSQRSDCPGTCQTCSGGSCVPVKNADDPTKCAGTCDSAGECKAKKGQKCSSVSAGCIAGTTCSPDDTCCDRACNGSCEACDMAGAPGTCTVLTSGSTPHAGHTPCTGTGTCAASCKGASDGSCTFPTEACGVTSCAASTYQGAGTCKQGTCSLPDPVSCKPGAACSGGACACALGTSDCGSACANLESDPKNCGACGHDCLGGPCEGGYCRPYKLADVAAGQIAILIADAGKVYAITQQTHMLDTSKVWQMDAVTPGVAAKIPPDQTHGPLCVIDGNIVWWEGTDESGSIVFGTCSVSGCLASTKKFSHTVAATGTTSTANTFACDLANKELVWLEYHYLDDINSKTYSVWRSSPTGANIRQITSFPVTTSSTIAFYSNFPVGRSDRLIYTLQGETTSQTYTVLTTTKNASPTLLVSGDTAGPSDLVYTNTYANDNLLVWSTGGVSYRAPLPNGLGSTTPPVFFSGAITSGIMDNYHFYGFVDFWPNKLQWCTPPSCAPTALANPMPEGKAYTQDAGAMYWAIMNQETIDGFSIWKVAKQPY